jgi:hypothetical protein
MKRDDVFPSKYLKCADLNGKPFVLSIASAPLETLKSSDGKEQKKIVLYFLGAKKTLPLNATNFDSAAEICGDDTDNWPGHKIELYPSRTQMAGKTVDCIRIRAPQSGLKQKSAPSLAPIEDDDETPFDDDVPSF